MADERQEASLDWLRFRTGEKNHNSGHALTSNTSVGFFKMDEFGRRAISTKVQSGNGRSHQSLSFLVELSRDSTKRPSGSNEVRR